MKKYLLAAVLGLALKFVEPEVKAYKAWKTGQ